VSVGGQQYRVNSTITLNTANTGLNGLDTGSLAADTLYYVYAVVSGTTLGLTASTAVPTTGPTGFSAWSEIGRFRTKAGAAEIAATADWLDGLLRSRESSESVDFDPEFTTSNADTTIPSTTPVGKWRRSGADMLMTAQVYNSSGAWSWGTGTFFLGIAPGYTIDVTKLNTGFGVWRSNVYVQQISGTTTAESGWVIPQDATKLAFRITDVDGPLLTNTIPFTWGTSESFMVEARIPIREWAGLFT
jgi:hypothetical protein